MSFKQIAQSLAPFVDPAGDVFIRVQIDGQRKHQALPLESRPGRAILRERLCDVLKKGYPTEHETKVAIEVIYGYALGKKRTTANTDVEYLLAKLPLARAAILLARNGGMTKNPTNLLAAVNTVAIQNDIDTKSGPWPKSEDALGRQLTSLIDLLAKKQIRVARSRKDERLWTIEPSDGSDGEATDATRASARRNGISDTSPGVANSQTDESGTNPSDDELKVLMNGVAR